MGDRLGILSAVGINFCQNKYLGQYCLEGLEHILKTGNLLTTFPEFFPLKIKLYNCCSNN